MEKYEKIMGHVGIPLDHTGKNIALSMKKNENPSLQIIPHFPLQLWPFDGENAD
jgi:hypothetical protein